jgi:hypothetical protein
MSERDDDLVARRYRELRREVPSAALDMKVLGAARAAVAPRSFARRWAAPLSAAAVVVLAVGVTIQLQREEGRPVQEQEAAPARAKKEAAPAASPAPATREEPQAIPFAPRRPAEPLGAVPEQKTAAPTAANVAPAMAPIPPPARTLAPAAGDLARAQREAADAVGRFGVMAPASPPAAPAPSGSSGPFSIDQATTTGPQVRLVVPR